MVCFDLDGVIALTEPLKAKAHISTVKFYGGEASLADYLELMGASHETVRGGMIQRSGIQVDKAAYSGKFRTIYHDLVEQELEIRPGVQELIQLLRDQGCLLAVVSSSTNQMVHQVLEKADLLEAFPVVVSANDVSQKKPHPEPYQKAIASLGATDRSCVIFEDSLSGILAGTQAGGVVIAVRHSMNQKLDMEPARVVLQSFDDPQAISRLVFTLAREASQSLLSPKQRD